MAGAGRGAQPRVVVPDVASPPGPRILSLSSRRLSPVTCLTFSLPLYIPGEFQISMGEGDWLIMGTLLFLFQVYLFILRERERGREGGHMYACMCTWGRGRDAEGEGDRIPSRLCAVNVG